MASPASIRSNNPGAMWDGPSSRKFGSTRYDVIGGGNHIAVFDDPVNGAAAQFDLMSRKYTGRPLSSAISEWSGGNNVSSYLAGIQKETGLSPGTVVTPEMMRDPKIAVPLARAMAQHEAGQAYPLNDQQWADAFARANGGAPVAVAASAEQQPAVAATSQPAPAPVQVAAAQPAAEPTTLDSVLRSLTPAEAPTPQQPAAQTAPAALPELPQTMRRPVDLSRLRQVLASRARLGTGVA